MSVFLFTCFSLLENILYHMRFILKIDVYLLFILLKSAFGYILYSFNIYLEICILVYNFVIFIINSILHIAPQSA